MKLQTQIPLVPEERQIDYQSRILLLGSCFAENIGEMLAYYKFEMLQNPFGILYHPGAVEKLVTRAVQGKEYTGSEIFHRDDRWHCFDTHSDLSDPSKEGLLQKLNDCLEQTADEIRKSTHILITLGTAWVYKHLGTDIHVANCHKVPQKEFSKDLLSPGMISGSASNMVRAIRSVNRGATLIFTVSPVRHLKDGFIENQRSKAHLVTALHAIIQEEQIAYFPAYELMLDELRDYRFYGADMVHPNALAIAYIWERFASVWISEEAVPVMEEVAAIQKGLQHRPFYEHSEQHQKFLGSLREKMMYLQKEYPFMEF